MQICLYFIEKRLIQRRFFAHYHLHRPTLDGLCFLTSARISPLEEFSWRMTIDESGMSITKHSVILPLYHSNSILKLTSSLPFRLAPLSYIFCYSIHLLFRLDCNGFSSHPVWQVLPTSCSMEFDQRMSKPHMDGFVNWKFHHVKDPYRVVV